MGAKVVRHGHTLPQTPTPSAQRACLFPALDTTPDHTGKVWTALRVRMLTTLELEPTA